MAKMTPQEARRFLETGTRTAKLATVRADGSPHVVPVWFVVDGDDLVFSTWHASVKAKNLRREPRVSLSVDDEAPPFSFVRVDGTATLSDDPDELARFARPLAARYVGEDLADRFAARNAVEGELVVRVTPTKVVGESAVSE